MGKFDALRPRTALENDSTTTALRPTRSRYEKLPPLETICERCGFYDTGPQFVEILRRQHHDAIEHADHDRASVFNSLLDGIDDTG